MIHLLEDLIHFLSQSPIGIPQLSMHAAREMIACQNHIDMCTFLTYFLQEGLG